MAVLRLRWAAAWIRMEAGWIVPAMIGTRRNAMQRIKEVIRRGLMSMAMAGAMTMGVGGCGFTTAVQDGFFGGISSTISTLISDALLGAVP